MDARTRFILGGIGGITPVILFLINMDYDQYVAQASLAKMLGYAFRATLLFLLGGFVAYLHKAEKKEITLFLVGVSAPSLLAGYISTANPAQDRSNDHTAPIAGESSERKPQSPTASKASALQFIIPSAYAQPAAIASDSFRHFTLPPQNDAQDFFQGLFGTQPKNIWFVIVGSYLDASVAKKQADLFNERFHGYHAEVYAPYGDNPNYAVVIAAHLTQTEAKKFRDKAVHDGFPKDSYYKTFPNLPTDLES